MRRAWQEPPQDFGPSTRAVVGQQAACGLVLLLRGSGTDDLLRGLCSQFGPHSYEQAPSTYERLEGRAVAYSVRITRTGYDGALAVYEWESTNGPSGHVGLDARTATFCPVDAAGTPIGTMSFRKGDGDVTNPEVGAVNDFLTVVSGIIKRWKETEPPETAHQYFG